MKTKLTDSERRAALDAIQAKAAHDAAVLSCKGLLKIATKVIQKHATTENPNYCDVGSISKIREDLINIIMFDRGGDSEDKIQRDALLCDAAKQATLR